MSTRRVALNENGRRIGEGHHRATIPDEVVLAVRELHEHGIQAPEIARKTGARIAWIHKVVRYAIRGQVARDWKTVEEQDDGQD